MKLWSINKWLCYTGFRIYVVVGEPGETEIGVMYWGSAGNERPAKFPKWTRK
jgi:hypothetical protein